MDAGADHGIALDGDKEGGRRATGALFSRQSGHYPKIGGAAPAIAYSVPGNINEAIRQEK